MSDQRIGDRTITRTVAPMLVASSLCLAACEAFVGSGPEAPYRNEPSAQDDAGTGTKVENNNTGGKPSNPPTAQAGSAAPPTTGGNASKPPVQSTGGSGGNQTQPPVSGNVCDTAPEKAELALNSYCGNCHSNPATAKAGFSTILDVPALLSSGKVVKNQPEMSLVYKRMAANTMPPSDILKRPGKDDITAVKNWIDCGAEDWNAGSAEPTAAFVTIDNRLRSVLDDLRSIPNPVDRERMRYFDVSSLSNGGVSSNQVQVYREAVSMLINSLSRGRSVIAPKAIDKDKLLYRIDLRDYLWDEDSWNQLEAIYPYAVIYDQDSRLFPFDEVTAEQIREETNTNIPVIQADWFISHAARPPLYHDLLELPDTLQGLEQDLGVDIQNNIDTEQVARSGFANAGPSQNNRIIERHELGGNRGALWLSYDFSNNLDDKNIFAHPLDFQEDGGEVIFNLDNGLQGYFVVNNLGTRLDKAPNNVVQDPASRDGAVENGLSCMNCHQNDGQLPKFDEIRDFQLNAGANAREIAEVLAIYLPADELQAYFDADQNRYRSARSALGIKNVTNTTMHQLDDVHLGIIDLDGVASVLGLPSSELKRAIDASPQSFPGEIVTLRTKGGGIQRDSFESIVADVIEGLGLGEQLLVNRNGSRRNNNNVIVNNNNNNDESSSNAGSSASAGAGGAGGSAPRRR